MRLIRIALRAQTRRQESEMQNQPEAMLNANSRSDMAVGCGSSLTPDIAF
jgi:hypothetical protein